MEQKLVLPCLRGLLGDWVFYSALMSAEEISNWIKPVKNIREATSLDEILQRDLKERKKAIANYLLKDGSRFFNSIIVGVFGNVPDWFEFDLSSLNKVIPEQQIGSIKQSVGIMVFSGTEQMFAIDGQHRVAGIQIAVNGDKSEILIDDQFSVIFVAHVDDFLGMKRTRKLFSDINKNAKPVSGGDKIKIDESDICSIVTRRIYASYPYFLGGSLISLTEQAALEKDDVKHFTNLLGLYSTNKVLKRLFKRAPKTQEWDEENVISFLKIVTEFYDLIFKFLEDYKKFFVDKEISISEARNNNSYLLYRPIGLKLIARLYVYFKLKNVDIQESLKKINKISFIFPNSPFNNVLWNNGKMEVKESNQKLAFDLSLYVLNEFPKNIESDLLKKYREVLKKETALLPSKIKF